MFRFTFDAIGAAWEIDTPSPLEMHTRRRILDRIERFDAAYSRFRPDSRVGVTSNCSGMTGSTP
jgi:thiamine biosynthesis lipoprotein